MCSWIKLAPVNIKIKVTKGKGWMQDILQAKTMKSSECLDGDAGRQCAG